MAEFGSKGMTGTALGLSIGALGTQLLNGNLNGLLGGLLGNGNNNAATEMAMAAMLAGAANTGRSCGDHHGYDRYDAGKDARIAELETEVKLRDANTYTDQKILATYQYVDGQLKDVRDELCRQRVHNQRTEDSFALASADLAAVKAELSGQIAMEAERRCCADNSIVNYANATFYPKLVADVTAGTTTTAQTLYNPIPKCGCCNGGNT